MNVTVENCKHDKPLSGDCYRCGRKWIQEPAETLRPHERPELTPALLLDMLKNGGSIVGSAALASGQIVSAQAERRMYVDGNGFGYVYEPRRASGGQS